MPGTKSTIVDTNTGLVIYSADGGLSNIKYIDTIYSNVYSTYDFGNGEKKFAGYGINIPGDDIVITPTVAPDHYYIDQASPATEYTVLQTNATNLIAHYKFDDNIDDSTYNGNNLTALSGTVQLLNTQYKIGKSAYFTNDSLKMNTFTFHNKPFAVAFWVYKTENGFFLIQRKANAVNQYLLIGSRYGGYELAFYGNDLQSTTGYTADMNTWVHLVYQIDASKNREIWRNGVRIANDTSTAFLNVDNNDVVIGNRTDDNDYFQGYLDDFRIYDTVLTADEISLLYNQKVLVNIEPQDIPTTTDYKTLTFTNDGSSQTLFDLTFDNPTECDILVVGGGGGGSGGLGGGGGAGGIAYISNATLQAGTYTINVGKGGIGGQANASGTAQQGTKGSNSTITDGTTTIIADGGGTPYSGEKMMEVVEQVLIHIQVMGV